MPKYEHLVENYRTDIQNIESIHKYNSLHNVQKLDDGHMYGPKHVAILKIKMLCLMENCN
jgi:hypothetical protein